MALPFVGVDGEGGDLPDRDNDGFVHHQYTMLRAGDAYVTPTHTHNTQVWPGDNVWLRFLASLPKKRIHVAYFFDYDVTMMLRHLPAHELKVLCSGQPLRTDGGFELGYRPRKEFTVKHRGRITTINDVGTFFQCKFVTALERWGIGTAAEREAIGEGKEQRANFGQLTADTVEYNRLECDLLSDLMQKFRHTCEVIGYLPNRWQGPGQLAKAMFRKHGIPKTAQLPEPPPGVWEAAQAAYVGGRFETSAVGPVRGPVDSSDLIGAYPYACTLLPCLMHGQWSPTRRTADIIDTAVYKTTFRHRREQLWYGLPVRMPDGSIRFPRAGSGWYWGYELKSAILLGAELTLHNGWAYSTQCVCRPFDFMHRLYSMRQAIGKSEAGLALKLAMNSAYGVCAQSVGQAPYANPVWAGLITAITRARLNKAIALDPAGVFMVATDGIFTRADYPIQHSAGLGGWELTTYPNGMHIVQPGVYFAGDKGPKTRGVPQTAILREEEALKNAWHGKRDDGLPIILRQFIGLRLAVARNAMHDCGEWMPVEKRVSYDWSTKRRPNKLRSTATAARTTPYEGAEDVWSTPYSRLIGGNLMRNQDRLEFADQPDWAETLTEVL